MSDKIKKTIIMSGYEEDVDTLIDFLGHVEYLGNVGASRNITLRVDGDGSGRMHFYKEDNEPLVRHTKKYNIEQYDGAIVGTYDIG